MKVRRWRWIALIIVVCLALPTGVLAAGDDQPKYKVFLGMGIKDSPGGVTLSAVAPKSPAAEAGLLAGDIILAVNGQPVNTSKEVLEGAIPKLVPYTPTTIAYQRGSARAEATIVPTGFVRIEVKNLPPRQFIIPGVPDNPPGPRSPIEALEQINVLKQVIIDPRTGAVAVVGTYDSSYATGPIPYLDLLKTALQYPLSGFSLNPTTDSIANRSAIKYSPRELAQRALLVVLGHPELEQERQWLISSYADCFGVSREEYVAIYNYLTFDNRTGAVPPAIAAIQEKMLRNTGHIEAADAYAALVAGNSEEALRLLGKAGGEYPGTPTVQAYFSLQEKIFNRSAQWAIDKKEEISERDQTELLIGLQRHLIPEWDKARKININTSILEKLVLSEKATQVVENKYTPFEAELIAVNIDPTSQLYRIMYEADYALKSLDAYPELFRGVPGHSNIFEYMAKTGTNDRLEKFHNGVRFWLEPRRVEMAFSPDRSVVMFGEAEVRKMGEFHDPISKTDIKFPDDPAPDVSWDGWCAQFNGNYDAYARIIPSFHKLREAAKVIALARWLNAEHIPVNLSGITQEKWSGPKTVPGFRYLGFTVQWLEDRGGILRAWPKLSGGVNFKSKYNWTKYTPAPVSETHVPSQLSLSAGLGQKAVQAAQGGNLEQAKYLAELSAQAMNGSISKSDLAQMNIAVPEAKPASVAPANVQLQKEMLKKTYQHINTLIQKSSSSGAASTALAQLNNLYDQVKNNPAAASDYLIKLQTGQLPVPAANPPAAKPAATTVCGEITLGAEMLPAERKEYLAKKLAEAKDRLKYINEALKKLIALNTAQRSEMEKLTEQINQDFEAAKERAYDFAVTTLIEMPLAKYQEVYEDKVKQMEYELKGLIGKSTTPMSNAARDALYEEIKLKSALKTNYQDQFAINKQLIAIYSGAGYGSDIYKWEQECKQSGAWKKGLDTTLLTGKILLDHPKLEEYLSKKEWFGGNKLWQVVAMGKMAAYGTGFFFDVMDLYLAWGPQVAQMKKDMQFNAQAMETLRLKAGQTTQQIDCLERLIK